MGIELVLIFLKKFWPWILAGVIICGTLGYIRYLQYKVDDLKEDVVQLKKVIQASKDMEDQLNTANAELTLKYKDSLKNQFALQSTAGQVIAERIKNDEASKHIAISPDAVSLFNGLKPPSQAVAPTVGGDVANPGTVETTLNDLLQVSNYNDNNHLKCIAQVGAWQGFWKDYEMNYKAIVNVAP